MPRFNQTGCVYHKRGAVAIFTVAILAVLIGFAALTIDVGHLYAVRLDLQNSADAASLSGASALAGEKMLQLRKGGNVSLSEVYSEVFERASTIAYEHASMGASGTVVTSPDVVFGRIDLNSATSPIDTSVSPDQYNAVRVITRREQGSSNGPIEFFFAPIFGKHKGEASASATAAFDDRVSGFEPGVGDLWPLTMSLAAYEAGVEAGIDLYDYDGNTDNVYSGEDGVPEVNMYPENLAPGNFGLLNIGVGNQGEPSIAAHIEDGVPPEHLENEIGTTEMTFYDADGDPVNYYITGNSGLKASLEASLQSRIGDIVAIPIHDSVSGTGANATYQIVGFRFARVMDAKLQGSPDSRGVWMQPVTYTGPGLIFNPNAPSSGGMAGRIVLVR